ncbi:MAG: pyridoxal-phosphate dependent enzyme [Thermomicrobiales bacterium]
MTSQPMADPAMSRTVRWPAADDLEAARASVLHHLAPTPLVASGTSWLKLETLQPTGSFKVRGAIAALSAAPAESRIIAASAGNHALGIAYASEKLGIPATVVIAETASVAKRSYLEQRPVTLIRYGKTVVEAEAHAIHLTATSDVPAFYVSPYNDPVVIAGQSTVLDEIVADRPAGPLRVIVPLGGGGLLAGVAMRAAELRETGWDIEVVGVESSQSLAVSTAVREGRTRDIAIGDTIADGLSGNIEPGSITVDILRHHGTRLIHVDDALLRDTVRWLIRHHGLVVEGAGAAAVAALRSDESLSRDRETIVILSGKNIAHHVLLDILREHETST